MMMMHLHMAFIDCEIAASIDDIVIMGNIPSSNKLSSVFELESDADIIRGVILANTPS